MKMKRKLLCICDYEEDCIEYWSEGKTYSATKHRDGSWSIETNLNTIGRIGDCYLLSLDDFDGYFKEIIPRV